MSAARISVRFALSIALVAAVTGAIYALRPLAPVLSLGVLYLFAVLPVAVLWGLAYAIPVSIASMLAFNFFFLPPVHTFRLADGENWFALAVYLVTAVLVSELAARARRRAAEAERLGRRALETEALRRSDAIKTTILRAVSHDLRSPLTAIRAAIDGIESDSFELTAEDRIELLATIGLETRRLERLVGNLLDLSRLEVGAATPHPALWTIEDLVGRALDDLGPSADRVEVAVAHEVPLIRVDGNQLERVLVNLIENALKFSSPSDPVRLDCRREGTDVVVRIIDRGPGVDRADVERIFEPFEREERDGPSRGTGLGLAIARGFAEANGAHVWAEIGAPHGSVFVLAVPAAEMATRVEA
jgi:two-component system sensor histidine kinase KdpD